MSLWSRAKRLFRSEDWKTLHDYANDDSAALDFTSDLVSGNYTNKNQWEHQLKVAWEDPIQHRNCVLLSKNVFDDWFVIKKRPESDDDEEELEEHPENKQIQEELQAMNAKFHFTQALIYMRIHGRSFLVFNYNKHRADVTGHGYQIASLDVFSEENTNIPVYAFDPETGELTFIEVYPNAVFRTLPDEIPFEELQFWCVDPIGRSYMGYSAMYSSWDSCTYHRESNDAMVWAHKKQGIGTQMWWAKGSMSQDLYDSVEQTLKDVSSRRAIVAETDKWDRVEWDSPSASGTAAIVDGLDYQLGIISAATGIPKDIYTGVSAGAITGSETNNKALYATISKIQSDITPYILDAIRRMGYDTEDMIIEWVLRYATDELEQAQIRLLNAQAAQLEMQVEQGGDPLTQFAQAFGQGEDPNQTQNQTGVQS